MASNAMKFKFNRFSVVGAIAALATTVSLAVPSIVKSQAVIKIDGSSTVYPITEAVAEEFQKQKSGIKVTVGISGTGGGFKKFCRGETDISNASRPILQKEIDACKQKGIRYIELPVAYDALTVVVNPQNTWADKLTVAQLKKMWEPAAKGTITNWNQINPNFPNAPLKLFGPGADSGTFDYFTEAIVGKSKSSRSDYTGSEDDNVLVQGVSTDKNAIGYFGLAYYENNKGRVKAVAIDNGKGPVLPSIQTVLDGSYNPLSRPIFIYVNAESAKRPEVKDFIQFYMRNGERLAKKVGYVPLPSKAYTTYLGYFRAGRVGSVFGG
ncbi:PstS family phosphate ABC transporter substrate-binding protein [Leptothermofonsia sp. ETS-13]|uniref:PstS family phosphate ABC transporter substrate-binding protein n=1 Tax=Leptothermofonsia sp. ETS-13 TaxID=3035696 RepID=UPI003B9F152D